MSVTDVEKLTSIALPTVRTRLEGIDKWGSEGIDADNALGNGIKGLGHELSLR
jgi:hypothetical protein